MRTVIGVTGSIGAGKSTVARLLGGELAAANLGAVRLINADDVARDLMDPSRSGDAARRLLGAVVRRFGADLLDESGRLIRSKLAERAFASPEAAAALNAMVHPAVIEWTKRALEEVDGWAILDVPLLFESGMNALCDHVIAVRAPVAVRRDRAKRFGDFDQREARQWSETEKAARADVAIDNDGTPEDLRRKVVEIAKNLVQSRGAFDSMKRR